MALGTLGKLFGSAFRNTPGSSSAMASLKTSMEEAGDLLANIDPGAPATAELELSVNPTDTDTVTIGTDVYEFCTAGGSVAADANIGVVIGGAVATSRTNLMNAINGVVAAATGLFKTDGVTPAERNGNLDWLATIIGANILLQSADDVGGAVECRADSTVVEETLTNAANIWDVGTGNAVNPGRDPHQIQYMFAQRTITAELLAFGSTRFKFANETGAQAPASWVMTARTSTGAPKEGYTDTLASDNSTLLLTFVGGGTDLVAGDVVSIVAVRT